MSHQQAAVYRQRAAHLRTLAAKLEHTPSMYLERDAGVDTWFGPRADACCQALAAAQRTARDAVDDLRTRAWHFDRTAEQLETAAVAADNARDIE
jgi:hypothetical protein